MGIRMRYFHIDNKTNIVINVVVWDGVSEYNPPNVTLLLAEDLPKIRMGDKKENNKWFRSEYNEETNEETWTEVVQ